MSRHKPTKSHRTIPFVKANHQIRYPQVRVLDEHGEMLGMMSSTQAQQQADAAGTDLVLVTESTQPPVVKLIELTKYKYQLQQKAAANRKSARKQDTKEVRFTPFMGEQDFQGRLKKVVEFLTKGDKVRLSLQFKGRAITKKEFGYDQFEKVFLATQNIAKVEMEPKLMGKKLIAQLTPSGAKKHEKTETENA